MTVLICSTSAHRPQTRRDSCMAGFHLTCDLTFRATACALGNSAKDSAGFGESDRVFVRARSSGPVFGAMACHQKGISMFSCSAVFSVSFLLLLAIGVGGAGVRSQQRRQEKTGSWVFALARFSFGNVPAEV